MVFLKSATLGLIGGITHIMPFNKNIIFSFFNETNQTFIGIPEFGINGSSLLFVNLGIILAILLLFKDKLSFLVFDKKNFSFSNYTRIDTQSLQYSEKQNLLLFVFYVSVILKEFVSLFVNFSGDGLLPLILWEICAVTLCFSADNLKEKNKNVFFAIILLFMLAFLGTSVGIGAVIIAIITAKLWGIEKKDIFSFLINVIFVSAITESVGYLINSVTTGFHFVWYSYLCCFAFAFLGTIFGIDALKKAILRKNIKLCGYFHVIFVLIMIYILTSV